jgi:hypothetical protein
MTEITAIILIRLQANYWVMAGKQADSVELYSEGNPRNRGRNTACPD